MSRSISSLLVATLAMLALGASALAGGWAVTTFDQLPPDFRADQPYPLGYTIRQHGQTPIRVDDTLIRITAASGHTTSFAGRPDGDVGHYTATVTFPAAGRYTWEVTQGPFAAQPLGTITVLAATSAQSEAKAPASPAATADPVRALLPFAAAAAGAMFVWRLLTLTRRMRRPAAA
jgi:hypothetical protein